MNEILAEHRKWVDSNGTEGTRAKLCDANLHGADLRDANLRDAKLCDADLCGADLCGAKLCDADLCDANLHGADLCGADLRGANLCGADLRGANLCGANLHGADLRGANLRGADLRNCIGNMRQIKSMQFDTWMIIWTDSSMSIGCQQHPIEEWKQFDDRTIDQMDPEALNWWKKWKDVIFMIIEKSR